MCFGGIIAMYIKIDLKIIKRYLFLTEIIIFNYEITSKTPSFNFSKLQRRRVQMHG